MLFNLRLTLCSTMKSIRTIVMSSRSFLILIGTLLLYAYCVHIHCLSVCLSAALWGLPIVTGTRLPYVCCVNLHCLSSCLLAALGGLLILKVTHLLICAQSNLNTLNYVCRLNREASWTSHRLLCVECIRRPPNLTWLNMVFFTLGEFPILRHCMRIWCHYVCTRWMKDEGW